jgi:hypothetical protein
MSIVPRASAPVPTPRPVAHPFDKAALQSRWQAEGGWLWQSRLVIPSFLTPRLISESLLVPAALSSTSPSPNTVGARAAATNTRVHPMMRSKHCALYVPLHSSRARRLRLTLHQRADEQEDAMRMNAHVCAKVVARE